MKVILVGTDFSPASDVALATAGEIASGVGARIVLLHVLALADEAGSQDLDTRRFYARLAEAAQTKLDAQTELVPKSVPLESRVEIGRRVETILELGKSLNAGLIVMGSRPIAPGADTLSVSHRLALISTLPILLAPI